MAALAADGRIEILDVQGRTLKTLTSPGEVLTSLAYSADGKSLMTGTDTGKVLTWNLDAGTSRVAFEKAGHKVVRAVWAPGRDWGIAVLDVAYDDRKKQPSLFVFGLSDGQIVRSLCTLSRDDYQSMDVSSDGNYFAVLELADMPRAAFLLAAGQDKPIGVLRHEDYQCGPLSVAISPDNNTIAVGYAPNHLALWDGHGQRLLRLIKAHSNWVVSLGFSPDGKMLVSGAGDGSALVWSVPDGREIGRIRFTDSSAYVRSVGFSADGKLVFAAAENGGVIVAEAPAAGERR